jgi:uncharacterized OB-fold protein
MAEPRLSTLLAHCGRCGTYTFPSNAWGCRACGADPSQLTPSPMPQVPRLRNFVTIHGDLSPNLKPPAVVGEVELAPGVVEEALLAVGDESLLSLDMELQVIGTDETPLQELRFAPLGAPA